MTTVAHQEDELPQYSDGRLPPHLYAELQARRRGFEGKHWPPRQAAMGNTPDETLEQIKKLQEGEHRTSLISAVGRGLMAYIDQMDPQDFRMFGKTMKQTIRRPENKTAAKCQAINWVMKSYIQMLETLVQKKSLPDVAPVQHIMRCMYEFFDEVGPEDIRIMVESIRLAAHHGTHRSKLATAKTTMNLFQKMLELYRDAYHVFVAESDDAEFEKSPRVVKAKEILADMKKRALRNAAD